MGPFVEGEAVLRADANGVARPKVDEGRGKPAVLNQDFVPPAGRIGPRLGAAGDDRPVEQLGRLCPESHAEGLVTVEVAESGWEMQDVIPGELNPFSELPFHFLVVCVGVGGLCGVGFVGVPVSFPFVEREVSERSAPLDFGFALDLPFFQ